VPGGIENAMQENGRCTSDVVSYSRRGISCHIARLATVFDRFAPFLCAILEFIC
jgi:hypothetical protein